MALEGREKATILLSILGADISQKIINYLPEDMADLLVSGVNNLPKPSPEMLSSVLTEMQQSLALPSASKPIEAAMPKQPAAKKPTGTPSSILKQVSSRALTSVLLSERPQTIAFVLTQLPDSRVSEVLTYLPEQRREVEYLINTIQSNPLSEKIKESVLANVASKLS